MTQRCGGGGLERLRRLADEGMPEREPGRYYGEYRRVFKPALFGDTSVMWRYELPPADLSNEWVHWLEPHFQAKFASMVSYEQPDLVLPALDRF